MPCGQPKARSLAAPFSSFLADVNYKLALSKSICQRRRNNNNKRIYHLPSLVIQMVKNLPEMQETQVESLGGEDPPGEGNGNPLQYSCLENSMDRGA